MDSEHVTSSSSSLSGARDLPPASKRRILILDDEPAIQQLLKVVLLDEGHDVLHTDDGREALEIIAKQSVDLIIQDLRMPKMDGLTFLRLLKERFPDIPSIVITAFGTFETAIEAMRLGAYTHLNKPFDTEEIRLVVSRALERLEISQKSPRANVTFLDIISNTSLMSKVSSLVNRIAKTDSTVLITGESGTGKELIARAIHFNSLRANQAFVPINCGAFTETLLESELFGHLKGSFTGAIADHKGVFESADRGTLFLDEVGDLSLSTQIKLLRVLESRTVKPVGGTRETKIDERFITATNRHLAQMVADGQFREDLYYRLNVIPIELPPLRERKTDIPLLAGHFLAQFAKQMNRPMLGIDDAVIERMLNYSWPGNVRELENIIERAVALSRGDRITLADIIDSGGDWVSRQRAVSASTVTAAATTSVALPPLAASGATMPRVILPANGLDLEKHLLEEERAYIIQALERCNWNLTNAAKLLNMTFRSIRYRVAKLGIERSEKITDETP